jgi:hypothetical protein
MFRYTADQILIWFLFVPAIMIAGVISLSFLSLLFVTPPKTAGEKFTEDMLKIAKGRIRKILSKAIIESYQNGDTLSEDFSSISEKELLQKAREKNLEFEGSKAFEFFQKNFGLTEEGFEEIFQEKLLTERT